MKLWNTSNRFGSVSVSLHWLMAVLMIGQLALGIYMTRVQFNDFVMSLYSFHKSIGVLILGLVFLRLFWRYLNIVPTLNISAIEKFAAKATMWLLYALMIALPITGWGMSSAAGHPVMFFGLFTLPNLVAVNPATAALFNITHTYLAYTTIGLIVLHVLGALKHHYLDKSDILSRMWWG